MNWRIKENGQKIIYNNKRSGGAIECSQNYNGAGRRRSTAPVTSGEEPLAQPAAGCAGPSVRAGLAGRPQPPRPAAAHGGEVRAGSWRGPCSATVGAG